MGEEYQLREQRIMETLGIMSRQSGVSAATHTGVVQLVQTSDVGSQGARREPVWVIRRVNYSLA